MQLEIGIPSELVPLATQAGNNLGRPDYLNLFRNNLATPKRYWRYWHPDFSRALAEAAGLAVEQTYLPKRNLHDDNS